MAGKRAAPPLAENRRRQILDAVRADGGVGVSALAERFGVTEMTVRRDLARLEREGMVTRVHGGAVPAKGIAFGERLAANTSGKGSAARKLEPFLPETGAIYLDGSTTMLNLVDALSGVRDAQVATNNVETFRRLVSIPGVSPLLLGGSLDRRTDNLVGALAMRSILAIAFDAAFFSCFGITPEHGPMEATLEDAEVKDLVASRSRAVYLAVDKSKLGVVAPGAWSPVRERTVLATDLAPDDARLESYSDRFREIR